MSDETTEAIRREPEKTDRPVSELEGAMDFLRTVITEGLNAGSALHGKLGPVLAADTPEPSDPHATLAAIDTRSSHVREITEQAERVRDLVNLLKNAHDRLDV